ncbi:Crp/Fnr family transcriptional regulator [Rhodospirillum centenum]|uniref:Nitrite and nitric oxide reductase regulator n=1 Tax=Rhodospirillum centenum (strain ATCC 51521 / SW) TaxID=414684 RepID=B6IYE4_RHOCS|nr:Crp/Fnr family transcriptional regulator [Rhodospirillum centenum]ACJ01318.1 nitrite and nitric oxide reductase regulator [Rhodospirillum centenum SW]
MPKPPLKPDAAVLNGMRMFDGLPLEALEAVIAAGQTRLVPKGTTVFTQGAKALTCHALLDGRIKIQQTGPDGQQVVVQFVGPGEMYGTLAMFLKSGYPGDAVTLTDSVEIVWSADAMLRLMREHPQIALNTLGMLGNRLEDLQTRLRELSTQRVERRVAHALLRLAKQAGKPVEAGVEIDFPLSRQDLAEMTGTTLHTVSRIVSGWESAGIVEGGRQQVVVARPDRLLAIAEDLPVAPKRS